MVKLMNKIIKRMKINFVNYRFWVCSPILMIWILLTFFNDFVNRISKITIKIIELIFSVLIWFITFFIVVIDLLTIPVARWIQENEK